MTSLEILDISKGSQLFMKLSDDPLEEFHKSLVGGAKVALGPEATIEDFTALLGKKLQRDTAKGIKMQTLAYITSLGQSRALENVRNLAKKHLMPPARVIIR